MTGGSFHSATCTCVLCKERIADGYRYLATGIGKITPAQETCPHNSKELNELKEKVKSLEEKVKKLMKWALDE